MQVTDVGIQIFRDKDFIVKRDNHPYYVLQLFWTPIYIKINGKGIVTPPHTLMIQDKDTPQYFHGSEDAMLNDYICFTASPEELNGLILNKPILISRPEQYHNFIRFIDAEHNTATDNRSEITSHLLLALLSKCKEIFNYYSVKPEATKTRDAFVQLRADILHFPYWDWNVSDMAKRCNLSVSRFQRAYKKLFSIQPMADVVNARILLAKTKLTSSHTIKEVAAECGYKSDIHFMNQFKKITGKTPSEFRKGIL